jgi:hypothetical protein
VKWWKGVLGLERDAPEGKSIIGSGDGLSEWANGGQLASRQDGDNFRTNRVTLADYQDRYTVGDAAVLGLAAAWACVNLLCGTQASLPLMVYRTVNGRRDVAPDHPLYRVLHDSPNADQTSLDYWEFTTACIELKGNSFSEVERRGDGSVVALDVPIAPDFVRSAGSAMALWSIASRTAVASAPFHRNGCFISAASAVRLLVDCRRWRSGVLLLRRLYRLSGLRLRHSGRARGRSVLSFPTSSSTASR